MKRASIYYSIFLISLLSNCANPQESKPSTNEQGSKSSIQQERISEENPFYAEAEEDESIQFATDFLNLLMESPRTKAVKAKLNKYLAYGASGNKRIYHPYIEAYKIEEYNEGLVTVTVKPEANEDEIDSDWTTKVQFQIIKKGSSLYINPSEQNGVIRSYWKMEILSENNTSRVDYREKWINANIDSSRSYENILAEVNRRNIADIWMTDSQGVYDGVFGENYHRIRIRIEEINKAGEIYKVKGSSELKDNLVKFQGTIKPVIAISYTEAGDGPPVVIISEYEFKEEEKGVFSGTLASGCYFDSGNLLLDERWSVSALYRNNTYVGIWKNSENHQKYKCIWGDGRLPYTEDFDIGTSETYINEKYRKYGWE